MQLTEMREIIIDSHSGAAFVIEDLLDDIEMWRISFADNKRKGHHYGPDFNNVFMASAFLTGTVSTALISFGESRSVAETAIDLPTACHQLMVEMQASIGIYQRVRKLCVGWMQCSLSHPEMLERIVACNTTLLSCDFRFNDCFDLLTKIPAGLMISYPDKFSAN